MDKWYLKTSKATEGPYNPRQLALRVISLELAPETVSVCPEHSEDEWGPMSDVDPLFKMYQQKFERVSRPSPSEPKLRSKGGNFDEEFEKLSQHGELDPADIGYLETLAVNCGSATNRNAAQHLVRSRARDYGCRIVDRKVSVHGSS